ncbi:hypothetical protein C8R43DRAFT_1173595, partial [Mycena crocata]
SLAIILFQIGNIGGLSIVLCALPSNFAERLTGRVYKGQLDRTSALETLPLSSFIFNYHPPFLLNMSSSIMWQNALNNPSPVTLHFDHSNTVNLECPHSPTSSIKGVFVRSRPSSIELSGPAAAEFLQFGMIGNTHGHVPFLQAPPASNRIPDATHSDTDFPEECSIRTVTPLICRTSDDDIENRPPPRASTERRTWPAVARLRSRVSGVFQHKRAAAPTAPPPSPTGATTTLLATNADSEISHIAPSSVRRTFSFSLRSRTSSISAKAKVPAAHTPVGNIARNRRVRRSRSFSGFTSMAHQVLAPIAEPEDMDEVALEAYQTARSCGRVWVYEREESGQREKNSAVEAMLERGVEGAW